MQAIHRAVGNISMKSAEAVGSFPRPFVGEDALRSGTRRYYDEHAQSYAKATLCLPLNDEFEPFVSRLEEGARVLDLGCGAGRDLREFGRRGFHAFGLDASLPLAELAIGYSGCPVFQADMRSMPFGEHAFAAVWASASLLHLRRREIPSVLLALSQVLKPSGYFFSSVKKGVGEGPDSKGRWFTYFEDDEWFALLADAGFDMVESSATRQASGTLDKNVSTDWLACIARKL